MASARCAHVLCHVTRFAVPASKLLGIARGVPIGGTPKIEFAREGVARDNRGRECIRFPRVGVVVGALCAPPPCTRPCVWRWPRGESNMKGDAWGIFPPWSVWRTSKKRIWT